MQTVLRACVWCVCSIRTLSAIGGVDLGSEVAIKKFYMLIWKCFYAEYLILLLL
jgi:hypothetical protein